MKEHTARRGPWLPIVVLVVLTGLATGGAAPAEEADSAASDGQVATVTDSASRDEAVRDDAAVTPVASGMTAFVDPKTGRLTASPTAEQRARLQAMIAAEMARRELGPEIEIIRRPDGSILARLNGRHEEYVGAFRLPDGTVVVDGQLPQAAAADR